ncbi:MAG: hypothetical protein KBD94_11440 [Pyrinomonadaceae bacterium]|nr:hypothetical protein [Pyrinomonadaceae bacterium]
MVDHWEEFQGTPAKAAGARLHVSLNHKGQIFVNKRVLDALGAPQAVVLLFDKVNSRIGVRAANPSAANAFPLKPRNAAASRMILASTFCRNYGIRVEGTVAFQGIKIDNYGLLMLDLKRTSRVSRVRI